MIVRQRCFLLKDSLLKAASCEFLAARLFGGIVYAIISIHDIYTTKLPAARGLKPAAFIKNIYTSPQTASQLEASSSQLD
jgi:hypothetical protein